ncbi:MAG TPA: hypothetical protein VK484_02785 [Ferruginibacter sp.]|nr:hypothetical protein [Ferruginibacter sp.]
MKKKINPKPPGRPRRTDKDNTVVPASERWTLPGEKRKTYIVNTELADKIDEIAHTDRTKLKDEVNDAFTAHVAKWEKKNGAIKLRKK